MGEAKRKQIQGVQRDSEAMVVDTPWGRIHVQWDHSATATPNAQLAFFAEFLQTTGLFKSWVDSCPLNYTSPNAPTKSDVPRGHFWASARPPALDTRGRTNCPMQRQ